jgi:hypothetical protein
MLTAIKGLCSHLVRQPWWPYLSATLLVLFGGGVGAILSLYATRANGACFTLVLDSASGYQYVRPLLLVRTPTTYLARQYAPLRDQIEGIARERNHDALARYSVYFRDLSDASSFGINELAQYDPASMLKVVVALAVNKQIERTPDFAHTELVYTEELAQINGVFPFAPTVHLKVGESYTIPFLLKSMLSDSDNAAKDLLLSAIDQSILDKIYTDLLITKPNDTNSAGYTISPLEYSRFLRVLYYGTYDLSWRNDDRLLSLLTQSTYTDGLVAGVPSSVPVAHKFGEHVIGSQEVVQGIELSDCGIIYHPRRPYLLCIMTQGNDLVVLSNVIADISRTAYTFVNTRP